MPCLARHLGIPEPQLRDAAQVLILRGVIRSERGVCSVCGLTKAIVVTAKR